MDVRNSDGEVIAVVTRLNQSIELSHTKTISNGIVVEHPGEVQVSGRIFVGNISNEVDGVVLADQRIAGDNHLRVRVHSQDAVSILTFGSTARDILSNSSRIYIVGDIAVNRQRAFGEDRVSNTFDDFVISVPSEDVRSIRNINTTVSMSGNGHLTTVANLIDREFDSIDNRNRIHRDSVRTEGLAVRGGLEYSHIVVHRAIR